VIAADAPGAVAAPEPVGLAMRRVEDRALLCGDGVFLDDLAAGDALHLTFVRSAHAHARLSAVDLTQAAAAPGVRLAFGARELGLPPIQVDLSRPGVIPIEQPILATTSVRFVGESIAAIVATDRYVAEDAAEQVWIDYEPLAPVTSVEDGLREDGVPLHGGAGNVLFQEAYEDGDVDAAFRDAAVTVERTFRTPRYSAAPMEARGVLAIPDADGLVVWSSTQIPHMLQEVLERLLDLPGAVRVRVPDIGGGFGQKAHVFPEEVAVAWAALKLGRPVKWVEDRSENLIASSHAREQLVRARMAASADGLLLGLDAHVYTDFGAYGLYPWGHVLEALGTPAMLPGPYQLRNYRYVTHSVATNKAPQGAYRGVGIPVATFVHERLMDLLAAQLGIDRAEIRRRNFIRSDQLPYVTATGARYDSGDYVAAMELALDGVGYDGFADRRRAARAEGRRIGLGFASYVEGTGTPSKAFRNRGMNNVCGYDSGRVALNPDGTLSVWTSCPAIGQGVATTFAQLVAAYVGVPVESVRVEWVDTAKSPRGSGSFASRSAVVAGGALKAASHTLRQRLIESAAAMLEARAEDIEIVDGQIGVRGTPSSRMSLAELSAGAEAGHLDVGSQHDPESPVFAYATHACVVEVERDTGQTRILKYVIAEDCGRIINPVVVDGQVQGATAQGIGGALCESMLYGEDGQAQTASFMDYLIPTACELPELVIRHLETPAPGTPGGFKGAGEGGTVAPGGALANAVSDALGIEINELPITPEALVGGQGEENACLSAQ
jgi:carbon-monoxide dehydrogenase large subunit